MTIKNKKTSHFIKFFLVFVVVFSGFYLTYIIYHVNIFSMQYVDKIKNIYSAARRFSSYYNNADSHYLKEGLYNNNNVSVIVNKSSEVKVLSTGINNLRKRLNEITGNHIWTVAVLGDPLYHSYFSPLRPQYSGQYDSSSLQRIIKNEGLSDTYQYFYGCNVKLTEVYTEEGTDAIIRTLYYPIYNNRNLSSILAVDIENNLLSESIASYNSNYATIINTDQNYNQYNIRTQLPCSNNEPIHLGVNFFYILRLILLPALFFAFLATYLMQFICRRKLLVQYDKMTNFYRRDFYEKKLQLQCDFHLLLIDIDHFKNVNDTFGHDVGDKVIRVVAKRISNYIRTSDAAIRWGGEEFIVSFERGMNKEQLRLKAEKICKFVASSQIEGIDISISIGGVIVKEGTFNDAYKMADSALYYSKENGRNRVTIA